MTIGPSLHILSSLGLQNLSQLLYLWDLIPLMICCVTLISFSHQSLSRRHPENSEGWTGSSSGCREEHGEVLLPEMCWSQFGSGGCSCSFSQTFAFFFFFAFVYLLAWRQETAETHNTDGLINRSTIQSEKCEWKEKTTPPFTAMPLLLLQVKSKQESDLKVKTFAPPYVRRR